MPAFSANLQLDEPAEVVQTRIEAAMRPTSSPDRRIGLAQRTTFNAQPGSIVLIRRYTPGWAVVLGIIGLVVFLLGLLFFLVRKTETLAISISARGAEGCVVIVSGEAGDAMIRNVQAALAGTVPTASSTSAQGSRSQAVRNAKLGKLK